MKIIIDMNLPPAWVMVLNQHGYESVHWSSMGKPDAPDSSIMAWALQNEYVVFTHDLDFGTLLALTHAKGPSVIQVRTLNVMPHFLEKIVIQALVQFETELVAGALVTIDEQRKKVRILPI
ncbi:MAG: DUF5615 family PIN-like protein [Anaerolineae bacterium]|nr:DUF5615 family PIN-like protein [Anaerolineae bacterium]